MLKGRENWGNNKEDIVSVSFEFYYVSAKDYREFFWTLFHFDRNSSCMVQVVTVYLIISGK